MKIQRSHFHIISLLLICAFLATVLLCSIRIGLITLPGSEPGEGNQPLAEEFLNDPESLSEADDPDADLPALPSDEYVTTGL